MSSLASPSSSSLAAAFPARLSDGLRIGAAVVAASVLVAVCAHMSVALPFTPVPVVLSDMAVLLVGLLLGPSAGAAALLLYLLEGVAGAPVFSPHGPGGIAQLLGPTGGFLLSYPVVAYVAGLVSRALRPRLGRFAASVSGATAGTVPLFVCGAGWLAVLMHIAPARAIQLAIAPFLLAAIAKILVASALIASLTSLRRPNAL